MNFPSFADALGYIQLGEACASAFTSASGTVFDNCYCSFRPIGIIFLYAIPPMITDDLVQRVYITLFLNLLLFTATFFALRRLLFSDPRLRSEWENLPPTLLRAIIFLPLLLNLISHLPVTLSDMPSLAFFMLATSEGSRILFEDNPRARLRRHFSAGFLVSISFLLKQTYIVYGFFLILSVLLIDRGRSVTYWTRIKNCSAFLLGMSPVLIQFINVYLHSGAFWLYEPGSLRALDYTRMRPNIETIYFSIPAPGAIMVKAAGDIDYLSFIVLKLFRALFGFEWSVYGGDAASIRPFWTLSHLNYLKVYGFVSLYAVFFFWNILKAPRSLKLLNLTALLIALFNSFFFHTELRFYLFPRIVFYITVLFWLILIMKKIGMSHFLLAWIKDRQGTDSPGLSGQK